jgi:hypothetical protein
MNLFYYIFIYSNMILYYVICTIFINRRVMYIDNYMIVICILKYKRPSLHNITIKMFFFHRFVCGGRSWHRYWIKTMLLLSRLKTMLLLYCLVGCYNFIILLFICEPIYMKIILINVSINNYAFLIISWVWEQH